MSEYGFNATLVFPATSKLIDHAAIDRVGPLGQAYCVRDKGQDGLRYLQVGLGDGFFLCASPAWLSQSIISLYTISYTLMHCIGLGAYHLCSGLAFSSESSMSNMMFVLIGIVYRCTCSCY